MAIFRTQTQLQLITLPLSLFFSSHQSLSLSINMSRKFRTTILSIFTSIIFFAFFSLYISRDVKMRLVPLSNTPRPLNFVISEEENYHIISSSSSSSEVSSTSSIRKPEAVLLPDWEVLLVDDSLSSDSGDHFLCLFENNSTSPAKFVGNLPFSHRATFKCSIPNSLRRWRRRQLRAPILTKSVEIQPESVSDSPEMLRYGFLAYDSMSTANDVILFVKGVNTRQGVNRSPDDLTCVFDSGDNFFVKTAVITSSQEVFRCHHPNMTSLRRLFLNGDEKVKISLEVGENRRVIVPSVAYYSRPRRVAEDKNKSLLCACTMVHNVAKFLKEWVMYNSELGVEKFILYDNDSQDMLQKVVEELVEEDYNVETLFWPWPKTQEAGFSHCAMHAMESCTWMLYMDVDEFVYSPLWLNSTRPSSDMLTSLLLSQQSPSGTGTGTGTSPTSLPIGQILIRCLEFGPSNQSKHPISGVTQGYTCRRQIEQRHKSIVLLNAIDTSLGNAIHHFHLKQGYRGMTLGLHEGVVNHYKYQAWSEFKVKFRRRVSAYVVDWRKEVNPHSQDRTPGLGFEPIEPEGWANRFCEVHDARLQTATRRWFGLNESSGYRLAWQ